MSGRSSFTLEGSCWSGKHCDARKAMQCIQAKMQCMPNLTIRVPDDERAAWEAAAAREDRKLGNWIRKNCNAALTERDPSEYVPTTEADPGKGRKVGSQTRDAGAGLGQSRSVSPEQPRMPAREYQQELERQLESKRKAEPFLIPAVEKVMGRPFKPDFKRGQK